MKKLSMLLVSIISVSLLTACGPFDLVAKVHTSKAQKLLNCFYNVDEDDYFGEISFTFGVNDETDMVETLHYREYGSFNDMTEEEVKEEVEEYLTECKNANKVKGVICEMTVKGRTAELNLDVTVADLDADFEDDFEDNFLLEDYTDIKEETVTEIKEALEKSKFICN